MLVAASALERCQGSFNIVCVPVDVYVDPKTIERASQSTDTLQLALELGRLDTTTFLLAWFGVLISLAAIIGFVEVRSRAHRIAREEARAMAAEWLAKEAPAIVRDAATYSVGEAAITAGIANEIAENIDDGGKDGKR